MADTSQHQPQPLEDTGDAVQPLLFGDLTSHDVSCVVDRSKLLKSFPKNRKWCSTDAVRLVPPPALVREDIRISITFGSINATGSLKELSKLKSNPSPVSYGGVISPRDSTNTAGSPANVKNTVLPSVLVTPEPDNSVADTTEESQPDVVSESSHQHKSQTEQKRDTQQQHHQNHQQTHHNQHQHQNQHQHHQPHHHQHHQQQQHQHQHQHHQHHHGHHSHHSHHNHHHHSSHYQSHHVHHHQSHHYQQHYQPYTHQYQYGLYQPYHSQHYSDIALSQHVDPYYIEESIYEDETSGYVPPPASMEVSEMSEWNPTPPPGSVEVSEMSDWQTTPPYPSAEISEINQWHPTPPNPSAEVSEMYEWQSSPPPTSLENSLEIPTEVPQLTSALNTSTEEVNPTHSQYNSSEAELIEIPSDLPPPASSVPTETADASSTIQTPSSSADVVEPTAISSTPSSISKATESENASIPAKSTNSSPTKSIPSLSKSAPTSAPTPAPAAAAPAKSWADLLKKPSSANQAGPKESPQANTSIPKKQRNSPAQSLIEFKASFKTPLIKPRGLINNGNMCFMNAILQPLVHCAPFYNLVKRPDTVHSFKSKTPLMDNLLIFVNEFSEEKPGENQDVKDESFEPEYIYDTIRALKKIDSIKGRQEDAEEFLGFLLDGLHEELLSVINSSSNNAKNSANNSSSDSSWVEVGPKNKTLVTRRTEIQESPITQIFGGRMRSIVKSTGSKDSITLEPFQALQLDITPDNVSSIEDALQNLTVPEILDGFSSQSLGGIKVEATKQNLLDHVPPVLILHLKRFIYNSVGGTQKVRKHVAYSTHLKIDPSLLSHASKSSSPAPIEYKLFAVVYHHGKFAAGGHYTCHVARQNGEWLHIDDTTITKASEDDVVKEQPDRQPYMLFFGRV